MREIKFRGKTGTGQWVYGDLTISPYGTPYIGRLTKGWSGVIKDTVSQYIGMKDHNDVEIYEGDIVNVKNCGTEALFEIRWRQEGTPMYILYPCNEQKWFIHCVEIYGEYRDNGLLVIGNIYDNPELVRQK